MVLDAIDEAWRERPEQVREQGERLAAAIAAAPRSSPDRPACPRP